MADDAGRGGGWGLEQIAVSTKEVLTEIKADIREIRTEIRDIRQDQKSNFRIIFGALISVAIGLAGLMAHGFKWL